MSMIRPEIDMSPMPMTKLENSVLSPTGQRAVFLVTTIIGVTGLWIAILAETGATVLVMLNALWPLRFSPEREV
jgi:Cd2+/Zn2+-exporting ATPase